MHELALAQSLVSVLEKEIQDIDAKRIKKVFLEVGRLRYIVPEIMRSSFEYTQKSDKLKDAQLEIEVLPVKLRCRDCKKETIADENDFLCESCSKNNVELISGKEFALKSIEW